MKKVILGNILVLFCAGFTAFGDKQKAKTVKVGVLHSLTGVLAHNEIPFKDAELMAIEEINRAGGVLGVQIEEIVEDTESQLTTVYPEKAEKLLLTDKVAVVFGCWTTVSRKFLLETFEKSNGLLFYPAAYEGAESSKNVVYSGATPNQQVFPAVDWLLSKDGGQKRRFYLLGNESFYSKTTSYIVRKYLANKGIDVIGETHIPYKYDDYKALVAGILETGPDVIVSTTQGDNNLALFDALAARGVAPSKIPVMATSLTERELQGPNVQKVQGNLAALTYFQTIDTPTNKAFVKRYQTKYGKYAVTNDSIASAYAQVFLWKLAVEKAGSFETDKIRAEFGNIAFDAPEGKLKISAKNHHVYKSLMIGKVRGDGQFDILHRTEPLEPEPYPAVAFPGWSCDWTGPGLIKGKAVWLPN
jgi:urea transport system substrate-binding protein